MPWVQIVTWVLHYVAWCSQEKNDSTFKLPWTNIYSGIDGRLLKKKLHLSLHVFILTVHAHRNLLSRGATFHFGTNTAPPPQMCESDNSV